MESRYQKIANALDTEVKVQPNWTPKENEKLLGTVSRKSNIMGHDLIVIDAISVVNATDNIGKEIQTNKVTVWSSTTLTAFFDVVKVGDTVGLKYLGETKGKSGRTYKNIKAVIEG